MSILTINCGSSTLKFDLFEVEGDGLPVRLASGMVDRIGGKSTLSFTATASREAWSRRVEAPDQAAAVREVLALLQAAGRLQGVAAAGHRVVHGGPRLHEPVLIDDAVLGEIERASELAPLHNAPALAALREAKRTLEGMPMVAAFDTGFYASLPAVAASYALPADLVQKYGIRRYGFHGLAHRYMVERFRSLRPDLAEPRLITFQLGNGCSVTASRGGRALDTSMGFTPLEGLVMGTRSGDLDPALPLFIAEKEGLAPDAVEYILNHASGLRGISQRSSDMRDLLQAAAARDEAATLAIDVFCYRARKYLGAYLAVLGGADGVVFGGGIGENSPEIRRRICEGMAWAGIELGDAATAGPRPAEARISRPSAPVDVRVVAVDEASVIARDVARCVAATGRAS